MRIALATNEELSRLNDDDRALVDPLRSLGIEAEPAVWSDPSVPWERFDAVVLRSTWNYHQHFARFLEWTDRVARESRLFNAGPIVRWNSHKAYLVDLALRGVRVVPTRLCVDFREALELARSAPWSSSVVKPAVSAGGFRTFRYETGIGSGLDPEWSGLASEGGVIVQPYLDSVATKGERSLVFFRGEYSHAYLRRPRLGGGDHLVEGESHRPSEPEVALGRSALRAAPGPTLYARVDMVDDAGGEPSLMELELIEPHLQLLADSGAPSRFARAIAEEVR